MCVYLFCWHKRLQIFYWKLSEVHNSDTCLRDPQTRPGAHNTVFVCDHTYTQQTGTNPGTSFIKDASFFLTRSKNEPIFYILIIHHIGRDRFPKAIQKENRECTNVLRSDIFKTWCTVKYPKRTMLAKV